METRTMQPQINLVMFECININIYDSLIGPSLTLDVAAIGNKTISLSW
jgi:hypothetical protein